MNEKNLPVSRDKVKERRIYAAGLKSAGFSLESVYRKVCYLADEKGWGYPSKAMVEKDIVEYYKRNRALTVEDFEYVESQRESHIAQMENTIEKMSLYIAGKDENGDTLKDKNGKEIKRNWSPFEYQDALEKLHKAQMNMAELQDWNRGSKRSGININIQQNTINAVFDSASADLKRMQEYTPKVLENLLLQIDSSLEKIKDQEYTIVGELTDDDDEASKKFIEEIGG